LTAAVGLLSWDSTHPDKLPWSRAGTTMLQLTGNWMDPLRASSWSVGWSGACKKRPSDQLDDQKEALSFSFLKASHSLVPPLPFTLRAATD